MTDLTAVRIGEYRSVALDPGQLTPRDVALLNRLGEKKRLSLTETRTGWRIKAADTVGVLVLDRIRLTIEPKLAIPSDQLLRWLSYALATPVPHEATNRLWATAPDGYADLVAATLLAECEDLLRVGLRRDYVQRHRTEPILRGRLDVVAQATRRYGQLDQLHVLTFDREIDIADNRILGTALTVARRFAKDPALARALHRTAAAFPCSASPAAALRAVDRAQYTGVNNRYRAAHTWARLILQGGGVTDLLIDGGTSARSLLLSMPRLWESVVRRVVTDALDVHGGRRRSSIARSGITVRDGFGKSSTFRPDVLLRLPNRTLPVDAKYKQYDQGGVNAADVHQLLTYATGYASDGIPAAVIVYPHPGGHSRRVLEVTGPRRALGAIHVLGIDTHAAPEDAVIAARSMLRSIEPEAC